MPLQFGNCPVPFPHLQNSCHYLAKDATSCEVERMRGDTFYRLHNVKTASFLAKSCVNPCAATDALDLALSSCYDHHRQFHVPRENSKMQCPTYRLFPWGK